MKKFILRVTPIPLPLFEKNLRKLLNRSRWDAIRHSVIAERGLKCETCGHNCENPTAINAHEEWIYDTSIDPATARINRIVLQCRMCHDCEHFFRMEKVLLKKGIIGKEKLDELIRHFCAVNGVSKGEFVMHRNDSWNEW